MRKLSISSAVLSLWALAGFLGLTQLAGCVERTISLTSEPSGALVYLNDQEVGRTPVRVPFTFYGTYSVRLEHDDYQPYSTKQQARAPWWEAPGPDLVAEMIPHNQVNLAWHFKMEPAAPGDPDKLIDHARQMRAKLRDETLPLDTQDTQAVPQDQSTGPDQPANQNPPGK